MPCLFHAFEKYNITKFECVFILGISSEIFLTFGEKFGGYIVAVQKSPSVV